MAQNTVKIRPQQISDAGRFFEILTNKNFIFLNTKVKTLKDELKFLQQNAGKRRKNLEHNYSIIYGGLVVGACGIKINQHRKYIGEIGYFVDENYWNKGIATEAVKLLEKIGFSKLKLKRIEILMDPRNPASEKVAKKAGYLREGKLRKVAAGSDGILRNCYLYAKVK